MGDPTELAKLLLNTDGVHDDYRTVAQALIDGAARLAESEKEHREACEHVRQLHAKVAEVEAERDRESARLQQQGTSHRAQKVKWRALNDAAEARAEQLQRWLDEANAKVLALSCQRNEQRDRAERATPDVEAAISRLHYALGENSAGLADRVAGAIQDALRMLGEHMSTEASMSTARTSPTADGGLAFYFDSPRGYALLEIHETGEVVAGHHAQGGNPTTWPICVSPGDVAETWRRLCEFVEGAHRPKDESKDGNTEVLNWDPNHSPTATSSPTTEPDEKDAES